MTGNRTTDTREKLEVDVRKFTERWGALGGYYMRVYGSVAYVQIIELLDRQAAITERHWMEIVGASANANIELKRHIDELKRHIDELNAALENGTCRIIASSTDGLCSDNPRKWFELSCGHSFTLDGLEAPVACAVCGKRVINYV